MDLFSLCPLPFVLQGLAMLVDEFYFHRKRGLGNWEIWGHPLDSLGFLACFVFLLLKDPSPGHLQTYIQWAAFSCVLVTKDEWIHAQVCSKGEMWLHSLLFLLHPLVLISAGYLWFRGAQDAEKQLFIETTLLIQSSVIFTFMLYQVVYWGFLWKRKSTTSSTTH